MDKVQRHVENFVHCFFVPHLVIFHSFSLRIFRKELHLQQIT